MAERKSGFVEIDQLQEQIDWETVWRFYGVDPGEVHRTGKEIRTKCFLNCGKTEETGDRAMAFDTTAPRWRCHQYGCGKGGNMVSLCGLIKHGPDALRPRGSQFIGIRKDLKAMVSGVLEADRPVTVETQPKSEVAEPERNIPLAESENERARALVNLDEKFLVTPDENMNRHAATYMRQRPYLSPETCREWRCGYLPHDTGGDKSGGTMRGKFVYPILDEQGQVLTWFGRDPQFEEKKRKWAGGGKQGREPQKFHFVKGLHRGLELFGQHRMIGEEVRGRVRDLGVLPVVEGPNDVIALDSIEVPALGLCSNVVTAEQARLSAEHARTLGVPVGLMLDNDPEGENGGRHSLSLLAQHGPVQLIWSPSMHGGKFAGRQPESLMPDEWEHIHARLHKRADNA